VIVVVVTPVLVFVAVIVTPGINAPDGSVTTPPNWANCAKAALTATKTKRTAPARYLRMLISPHSPKTTRQKTASR
jgi:hypothetical protein